MPRLLLVDDNPSIHRIAESLLAPTDVEVVCVDSAAEALDRLARGERFDVALVDTAMPGMDGWALLARLRDMEACARLPIAMMAGVLDPVDPARLAQAPIQGFLKKPIELRELADRVRALLATPVAAAAPAAPPAPEPAKTAEFARPAFPPDLPPPPVEVDLPSLDAIAASPQIALGGAVEDDLLVLTAEDLWPEDLAAGAVPVPMAESVPAPMAVPVPEPAAAPEVHLDLEELDLDSLHGLTIESLPPVPAALPGPDAPLAAPPASEPVPAAEALAEESLPAFASIETLDDLGGTLELPPLPEPAVVPEPAVMPELPVVAGRPPILPVAGMAFDGAADLLDRSQEAHQPAPEPPATPVEVPARQVPPVIGIPPVALPVALAAPVLASPAEAPAAVSGQAPAAPGQAALTPAQVQALLADPALMDALVKALVARMGDQVIREIAWEVMPELAGRLQR